MQGALRRTAAVFVAAALVPPAAASQQGRSQPREPAPVIVEVRDDGFDWSAAGIGAVGGVGLALIAGTALGRFGVPRRPLGNTRRSRRAKDPEVEAARTPTRAPADDRPRATGAVTKGDPR